MKLTKISAGSYSAKTADGREWRIVRSEYLKGLFVCYDINDSSTVFDPEPLWYVRKCLDQINQEHRS